MLNFTLFTCLSLFSSPWTRPPPASFCLNSVKTTSIHFSSYLFNVSTLCNSSDDRIPNEVTMVLMHFFVIILLWSNWGSIKFLKYLLSRRKFAKNKQNCSFLFFFTKFVFCPPNPFVWRYIPRVPIMPHQFWFWPGNPLPLVDCSIHMSGRAQSQTGSLLWSAGLWRGLTWLTPEKDDKEKQKHKHKDNDRRWQKQRIAWDGEL